MQVVGGEVIQVTQDLACVMQDRLEGLGDLFLTALVLCEALDVCSELRDHGGKVFFDLRLQGVHLRTGEMENERKVVRG